MNPENDLRKLEKPFSMHEINPDDYTQWICSVCGHIHIGPEPPSRCPVCGVSGIYFDEVQ